MKCGDPQLNVRGGQELLVLSRGKYQLKFRVCKFSKDACLDIRRLMMLRKVKGDLLLPSSTVHSESFRALTTTITRR